MTKVVVSSPKSRIEKYGIIPPKDFELIYIDQPYTDEELIEAGKDATFMLLSLSPASKKVIDSLDNIKLIQSEGVGFDGIDTAAAKEAGVYVCNARGVNKVAVAEHTIGLMLAAIRRTCEADKEIKKGNFEENYKDYQEKGIRELIDSHVGLIGTGDIGMEVLKRLKPFGCKLSYFDVIRRSKEEEEELGLNYVTQEEILKECDIISLHVPLLNSTHHLINKDTIEMMRPDAIIINTARGDIINQEDLAEALINNKIEGAAIDTLSPQPPNSDHPLLNLPEEASNKLTLTTHIAGITTSAFENMQRIAWNNMEKVLRGERPDNIVNKM